VDGRWVSMYLKGSEKHLIINPLSALFLLLIELMAINSLKVTHPAIAPKNHVYTNAELGGLGLHELFL